MLTKNKITNSLQIPLIIGEKAVPLHCQTKTKNNMDCNIEKAQMLLANGNATKEELQSVLKDIVDNYSTRPRIVIYLDDYEHTKEEIIRQASERADCSFGYEPDFYTTCMEDRKRFEELVEDLEDYSIRLEDEDEDTEYIKNEMQRIIDDIMENFGADYSYYLD